MVCHIGQPGFASVLSQLYNISLSKIVLHHLCIICDTALHSCGDWRDERKSRITEIYFVLIEFCLNKIPERYFVLIKPLVFQLCPTPSCKAVGKTTPDNFIRQYHLNFTSFYILLLIHLLIAVGYFKVVIHWATLLINKGRKIPQYVIEV